MDEYIDIAKKYIAKISYDICGIVPDAITEYEDVILFYYQSKNYLQTGDFSDMLVGQGPCFIIKKDNRIVSYGSAWWEKDALKNLRKFLKIETDFRKENPEFDAFKDNYYLEK